MGQIWNKNITFSLLKVGLEIDFTTTCKISVKKQETIKQIL